MTELQPIIVFHSRHFVRHLGICKLMCQSSTTDARCHYTQFSKKNEVSILKLLQVMSGVISSNLKEKRRLYLKPFS